MEIFHGYVRLLEGVGHFVGSYASPLPLPLTSPNISGTQNGGTDLYKLYVRLM